MTLKQLGKKLKISTQGVKDIEDRESTGSITIKSLKQIADVLDMQLVYALVPKQNSIDEYIELKVQNLAKKIVLRTSHNMKLEDQGLADEKINLAIQELTIDIKREMRKSIWD